MSGRELAERLGARRPAMKVLYMSGYTDDAMVHKKGFHPGRLFLQKPFTLDALARKLREVLQASEPDRPT
jgi:FixJ family two-component response regulator